MNKAYAWVAMLLCVAAALHAKVEPEKTPRYHWWTYDVDTTKEAGLGTQVRVDKSGKIHIAYRKDDKIIYAAGEAGNLSYTVVSDTIVTSYGGRPTLAVDSKGKPYVLFSNWSCEKLYVATPGADGKWTRCLVEGAQEGGHCYSFNVEVGPDDCVHVVYPTHRPYPGGLEKTHRTAYAKICPGECNTGKELYWNKGGKWNSIAFDKDGKPGIAFFTHDYHDLHFAMPKDSNWQKDSNWTVEHVLDTNSWSRAGGKAISMQYGKDNRFHILHNDDARNHTYIVRGNAGGWIEEDVDTLPPFKNKNGQFVSIYDPLPFQSHNPMVLEKGDAPLIARYDWVNLDMNLLYKSDSTWYRSVVDTAGNVGMYASLALDNLGRPVVAYHDSTLHSVRLSIGKDIAPPDTNKNGIPDHREPTVGIKRGKRSIKPKGGRTSLKVFDLSGRLVQSVPRLSPDWEKGLASGAYPTGLYIYEVTSGDEGSQRFIATGKAATIR